MYLIMASASLRQVKRNKFDYQCLLLLLLTIQVNIKNISIYASKFYSIILLEQDDATLINLDRDIINILIHYQTNQMAKIWRNR